MNKNKFIEQYYVERKNTTSVKWDLLEERFGNPNLISMWVADMDFKTCDSVTEALKNRIEHGVYGYSYIPQSYYDSFFDWMENKHGYRPQEDWVRISTGIVSALYWFVNCFTKPNDSIIIMTPVYYPFHNAVKDCNRNLVTCDMLNKDGCFTVNFDAFEKAIVQNNVKMYIMCSPHNPVGRVWKEEELDRMLSICEKHNVLVISDEIHQDFVFGENKHIPATIVSDGKYSDNIILVNAASKTFNLASLLNSNIIISSSELRAKFDEFSKMNIHTGYNTLGLTATEVAYATGLEWLDSLKDVIQSNYDYIKKELKEHIPEIIVSPLEGTYLLLLDMRACIDPENIKDFVQDKCNIAVDYGEWFGKNYKGFIRLNIATHPQIIEKMVANFICENKKLKMNITNN